MTDQDRKRQLFPDTTPHYYYQPTLPGLQGCFTFCPLSKRRGTGRQGPRPSASPKGEPDVCTDRPPTT